MECSSKWRYLVYIDFPGNGEAVKDGVHFRCFEDIDRAKRYAILLADAHQERAPGPNRSEEFMQEVRLIATSGEAGVAIGGEDRLGPWRVVIEPRDTSAVDPNLP
jgi:hypothetical protein